MGKIVGQTRDSFCLTGLVGKANNLLTSSVHMYLNGISRKLRGKNALTVKHVSFT